MKNKEVMRIAKRYIGQGGAIFRKYCNLPNGASYCNAYVDYIAHVGGVSSLYFNGAKETYCPHSIKWCQKYLAQIPMCLAMPMDIIYFDWEKNGQPNHIGFVVSKVNTSTIKTIEGNTTMKKGKKTVSGVVAEKTRAGKYVQGIFRPHYKPTTITISNNIAIDGSFQYQSIVALQRALSVNVDGVLGKKTVAALQKKANCKTIDGAWATATSKSVQLMLKKAGCYNGAIDGAFGDKSIRGLQKWCNKMNATTEQTTEPAPAPTPIPEPTPEPRPTTSAEKIISKINEYAYPYGTSKKKYSYKNGSPRSAYKSALKKYMNKTARISQSDCGYFVSTVIRSAGISKSFLALRGRKESFPKVPSTMKVVHKGKKIPSGLLKAGDVIRYKKSGGGQHTLMYYGNGKIAEAGRKHYFPAIKKDTKKYNKKNVKKSTIQVLRAK